MKKPDRAYDSDWYEETIDRLSKEDIDRQKESEDRLSKTLCEVCGKPYASYNLWKNDRWMKLCLECYKKG